MNIMKLHGSFDAIDPFLDAVAHWQQDYIKLDDSRLVLSSNNTSAATFTLVMSGCRVMFFKLAPPSPAR